MKRSLLRLALPLAIFFTLPFSYNACNKSPISGGFDAAQSSCKLTLEKGVVSKLEVTSAPNPFAERKVLLRENDQTASAQAKATAPITIAQGEALGILMDNACIQARTADGVAGPLTNQMAESGQWIKDLPEQVYSWVLDREYSEAEIEELASHDNCILGLSWNRKYAVQSLFNDPNLSQQTYLTAIGANAAYDYYYASGVLPPTSSFANPAVVAVIDTGVDWQHPDISPSLWLHSLGTGVDITTLGGIVDYNPYDVSPIGHGTHVAGMIGAAANNGVGIAGTLPTGVKLMNIKVFKSTNGSLSTTSQYFYNALKYAYLNKANVINLSLGAISSGTASDALAEKGVNESIANGVVVVTVIGNADSGNGVLIDGTSMSSIPGQYSTKAGVIGVGSFDVQSGNKSYFSHYSTTFAEIGAPGAESSSTGVYSTIPRALGSYGRLSGTSQAAPQVSAAAALTYSLIRNAYGLDPSPAEVERLILASANKTGTLATYFKDGNRLDMLSLVKRINLEYPKTIGPAQPVAALKQNCQ